MVKTNMMSKQILGLSIWSIAFIAGYLVISPAFAPVPFTFTLFLAGNLIWICTVDLEGHRIPNITVILIALAGVVLVLVTNPEALSQRLVDTAIVLIVMYTISAVAKYISKNQAIGFGDVKLLSAATVWLGMQGIYAATISAFAAGLLFVLVGVLAGKRKFNQPIALGPFISLGIWGAWLFSLA